MSTEYRLNHLIARLLTLLDSPDRENPQQYLRLLSPASERARVIVSQLYPVRGSETRSKLAQNAPSPSSFLACCDSLFHQRVPELGAFLHILAGISDDATLRAMVRFRAPPSATGAVYAAANEARAPRADENAADEGDDVLDKLQAQLLTKAAAGTAAASEWKSAFDGPQARLKRRLAALPVMPRWQRGSRPYLTAGFVDFGLAVPGASRVAPASELPIPVQEMAVVEDLLYLMIGIEGRYVRLRHQDASAHDAGGALSVSFLARAPSDADANDVHFDVDPTLDPSISQLVGRILPLCRDYNRICRFVESCSMDFERGAVVHALCASIRELLKEYTVLVAQLEHALASGSLSLQRLWFYVQPSLASLGTVASTVRQIAAAGANARGATVLTLLHERVLLSTGDAHKHDLCVFLARSASAPFFRMLHAWIYRGVIIDTFGEFCVEEREEMRKENLRRDYNDTYWELRYTIVPERVPVFLAHCADTLLHAGKYLNVIRECGRDVSYPDATALEYSPVEHGLTDAIAKAHVYASRTLLTYLVEEHSLFDSFRSLKHYFLFDFGDFMVHFMDTADSELRKGLKECQVGRVQSLLEMAIRGSSVSHMNSARRTSLPDEKEEDSGALSNMRSEEGGSASRLRCALVPYSLTTQLFRIINAGDKTAPPPLHSSSDVDRLPATALEAFTFDYEAPFPLSLVINRKSVTKYQLLFRHLFYAKHVERQLCNTWIEHKLAKNCFVASSSGSRVPFASAFALRQRMISFVQNYELYMMFEVIERQWHLFDEQVRSVGSVDELLALHNDLLDSCLKECMLSNPDMLKIISSLMSGCEIFSHFMARTSKRVYDDAESLAPKSNDRKARSNRAKIAQENIFEVLKSSAFEESVSECEANFTESLNKLLRLLHKCNMTDSESHTQSLLTRLNFNGFYSYDDRKR